jgi:hypothetical protein
MSLPMSREIADIALEPPLEQLVLVAMPPKSARVPGRHQA